MTCWCDSPCERCYPTGPRHVCKRCGDDEDEAVSLGCWDPECPCCEYAALEAEDFEARDAGPWWEEPRA